MRINLILSNIIFFCALLTGMAQAQQQPDTGTGVLELQRELRSDAFEGRIAYLLDPEGVLSVAEALQAYEDNRFEKNPGANVDFGYTKDVIWLRIALRNPTPFEDWRFRMRENFFQGFKVWLEVDGQPPRLIESQDVTTPFDTRAVAWPELVAPFSLAQGSDATIWIRYWSGGSSEVEMNLFEANRFAHWADRKTARNFIYYGMLLFLIVTAAATWLVTRQGIFVSYSSYALCGLLFIMHADGNAFRYLWSQYPAFNAYATIPIGSCLVGFGANFARQFLQTAKYHPVFDRLMFSVIVVCVTMFAASAFVDHQWIKKNLVLVAMVATLLFTASGINAARTRFSEVRFYVLAWFGAVISSAIMTGRHWLGLELSEEVQFDSMRIVFVMDAALMGLAILDRFNQMRQSRSDALEASLSQAERNLALSKRLQDLEQRYSWAANVAKSREEQVADAIHDLRQPLNALRLNVQSFLAQNAPPEESESDHDDIELAFGYIERLIAQELAEATSPGPVTPGDAVEEAQVSDLAEVLGAIDTMFAREAAAKGLDFRVVSRGGTIDVPPLPLMRLASNLVSNAIRYTAQGRVLVGVRSRPGGALRFEIHDTGPGLDAQAFKEALPRHARLPDTDQQPGSGIGLAVVSETCEVHGLTFGLIAERDTGTSLGVTFPGK